MLRGPQTPGELKQRGERMHAFADLAAVHATLDRLIERELAVRLGRRPGHKEERYAHLLGLGDEQPRERAGAVQLAPEPAALHASAGTDRPHAVEQAPGELAELRARIERLEREVAELRGAAHGDGLVRDPS